MDILRIVIVSILTSISLLGCDYKDTDKAKPTTYPANSEQITTLTPQLTLGDTKQYWIQSYSSVFQNEIDWSNKKQRLGIKALVSYQIKEVNHHQIKIDVTTNHIELLIKDNAAYLHPLLQTTLTDGLQYLINLTGKSPLQISQKNQQVTKQIAASHNLQTEYQYLESLLVSPFLPMPLPLQKDQQIIIPHFMQMTNLTATINDITTASIHITLEATEKDSHLYGKAVLQKDTSWLERLALVKEAPMQSQPSYKMRTVLMIGPSSWSNKEARQLTSEMQIKDTDSYLRPFTIFNFDVEHWQQAQLQEKNNQFKQGSLYTLTNSDGSSQLMLVTNSYTDAVNQLLGHYQATNLVLFDKNNNLLPHITLFPTTNIAYKIKTPNGTETNLVSYKLALAKLTKNRAKLEDIAKITANISFTPYHLEKITLPLTNKTQTVTNNDNNFSADISPTNKLKSYILHWQANDNVIFNPQLMQGINSALVQYIQPDTVSWLTPAETRILNSITKGFENTIKITFITAPPKELSLYIIKQHNTTTAINGNVTFIRHP